MAGFRSGVRECRGHQFGIRGVALGEFFDLAMIDTELSEQCTGVLAKGRGGPFWEFSRARRMAGRPSC